MSTKKIIIIMTDTQRKDMLGCYGNPNAHTPNLDRLAEEGVRFAHAYCAQPVCGPARSAIFTGTYPHTNGVVSNGTPLSAITKHIGQRVKNEGFDAAYIGKWHLDAGDYFGDGLCPEGWNDEYWYDMRNYLEEMSEADRKKSRDWSNVERDQISREFTFANRCSNRAIEYIEKNSDQDYLLVVSYDEPHHPWLCPKEYYDQFQGFEWPRTPNVFDTLNNKPDHQKLWAEWVNHGDYLSERDKASVPSTNALLACNAFVDSEIGRVLDTIDTYAKDALIIYTADHGCAIQSHCLMDKGPAMYDEITNIPFIVKWEGHCQKGEVNEQLVSHVDIVPTMLEALEQPIPGVIEGTSLLPTIINKDKDVNPEIFMEFTRYEIDHDAFGGYQPIRCIRDQNFKLVINLMTSDELYDMVNDPYEMNNLIDSSKYIEVRNGLHDRLLEHMNETRDNFRGYYWERRPWRQDARQASWPYTQMTRQRVTEEDGVKQLDYATGIEMETSVRIKE